LAVEGSPEPGRVALPRNRSSGDAAQQRRPAIDGLKGRMHGSETMEVNLTALLQGKPAEKKNPA